MKALPRVLVVDDDESIRQLFANALKAKFDVITAADGIAGRSQITAHDVVCIVADQMMPGLTGVELLKEASTLRPYAARLLVTASERVSDLTAAVNRARVHRFLSKPVRLQELVEIVEEAIRLASLESENQRLAAELLQKNTELQRVLALVQESEKRLEKEVEERTKDLSAANKELKLLALRDTLTGLYNHRLFQESLTAEFARASRYGNSLSLVLLDVDHFRHYNEKCGHSTGDELLRQLARLLAATDDSQDSRFRGRSSDVVARFGGDEFVVILPMTDKDGALACAGRMRELIARHPFLRRDVQPGGTVTVSAGVATFPRDAQDKTAFVKAAQDALAAAKQAGRNRVVSAPDRAPALGKVDV